MATWSEQPITDTNVDGTIVVARPAFVANFYAEKGMVKQAVAAFDAWYAMLPEKAITYYGHGNSRKLAKLDTAKAQAKVRAALSPKSIDEVFQWYHAKDGTKDAPADECSGHSFEIFVAPEGSSYVYITLPLDFVDAKKADAAVKWFGQWCEMLGATHADAGFGWELAWFAERAQVAYPKILATGLRHHGVRLWHRTTARMRDDDGQTLDTAAWLTYVDGSAIERLAPGAIDGIDAGVTRHKLGKGVLLQAGKLPDACDVNRPGPAHALLRSVNAAVAPIRTRKWWVNGFAGDPDKENRWLGRMDP